MAEYFKCDGFDRDGYPCSSERGEADRRAEGTSGAARIGGKKIIRPPTFPR